MKLLRFGPRKKGEECEKATWRLTAHLAGPGLIYSQTEPAEEESIPAPLQCSRDLTSHTELHTRTCTHTHTHAHTHTHTHTHTHSPHTPQHTTHTHPNNPSTLTPQTLSLSLSLSLSL